jgi:hypothetical protein
MEVEETEDTQEGMEGEGTGRRGIRNPRSTRFMGKLVSHIRERNLAPRRANSSSSLTVLSKGLY